MKYLKILSVALSIGLLAMACEVDDGQDCYRCTASEPSGTVTPMSSDLCEDDLTQAEKDAFRATFEAQHDPSSYTITCEDID